MVLCLYSCGNEFTDNEYALLKVNGIETSVSNKLEKESVGIEQLYTIDKDFNELKAPGILLKVKPKSGAATVGTLRKDLDGTHYQAYLFDNHYGYGEDEIAIVANNGDIEYLKIVRTDGINYDLTAEDVLQKYIDWDSKYDLKLTGAGRDWLEAKIIEVNVDWNVFAKEVYEFCPDVVDQGTGTLEALETDMKESRTLYLWWD